MRWLIITVLVLLWAATFALGLGIAFGIEPGFDAESAIKSIGTLSTGLTAAVSYFGIQLRSTRRELEEERFSTPMALAYGYAHNFLEPAATALIRQSAGSGSEVKIYVYIPERLEELEPLSRQRILARIRGADFHDDIIKLELDSGRARDLITVTRSGEEQPRYFDFPTTLLTLTSLVDYKVASAASPITSADREALGREYIQRFRDYLLECIGKLRLEGNIELTDAKLAFLNGPGDGQSVTS
jgi:hypothetical protein